MKHFCSFFWLGEICASVNIATLLLRCILLDVRTNQCLVLLVKVGWFVFLLLGRSVL